jgi:hypothetical protein
MGRNSLRERIRSLERRIAEHQRKLRTEATCPRPNEGVIRHWLADLRAFRAAIARARKRLGRA